MSETLHLLLSMYSPRTLCVSITRIEIILAIHSHTSLLYIALGRHCLSVYACAAIVSFPNQPLLGTRLVLTFELRLYAAPSLARVIAKLGLGLEDQAFLAF